MVGMVVVVGGGVGEGVRDREKREEKGHEWEEWRGVLRTSAAVEIKGQKKKKTSKGREGL